MWQCANTALKKLAGGQIGPMIIDSAFSQEAYNLLWKTKVSSDYNAKHSKVCVAKELQYKRVQRKISVLRH